VYKRYSNSGFSGKIAGRLSKLHKKKASNETFSGLSRDIL